MSKKINWKEVGMNFGIGALVTLVVTIIHLVELKIRKHMALKKRKREFEKAQQNVAMAFELSVAQCDVLIANDKYDDDIKQCFKRIKALTTEMKDISETPFEEWTDELTERFDQLREEWNDETSWLRIELRERYDEYI